MKKPTSNRQTLLKVGWWVALTLKPDTASLHCFVGQIEAISDDGIRLTLVDWFDGMPTGYDFYVPHRNIESALVCTDKHNLKGFGDEAGRWQKMTEPKDTENNELSALGHGNR
jgi:hypothetical protein